MNKLRRKEIEEIRALLNKAQELAQEASERLESVRDDEQEYYDNMPAGPQEGDRGQEAQENIDELEAAVYNLETIDSELDEALGHLETAAE